MGEVLEDAYIGLFAVVMLGSMLVNVLVHVAGLSDENCVSAGCREARSWMPWLAAGGVLVVVWAAARTFGPVFVTPGAASWLLASPVDRGEMLRTRLWGALAVGAAVAAAVGAAVATLGGFGASAIGGFTALCGALAAAGVALMARGQSRKRNPATILTASVLILVTVGLVLLGASSAPELARPETTPTLWWVVLAVVIAGTLTAAANARRSTAALRSRDVSPGGNLAPGLGGALATLDLALMYDVLLAHRWRRRGPLRSWRRVPAGPAALIHADLVRAVRSPIWLVLLAASVSLPYAIEVAGGQRVVVLVVALTGFVGGLPLLAGLRVLTRSQGMLRNFPTSLGLTRGATLVVPGLALVLHGLASAGAVQGALVDEWAEALVVAAACGVAGLAAACRWVTGRPPDYGRPLVSSPAGAVPTNLYGSALRGFDVLLLTTAPLLISPTDTGALVTVGISLVVLTYLASRK